MGKWFLIILGLGLIAMGVQECRLRGAAHDTPQVLTCEELGKQGPGDNANVKMTDYVLCIWDYVIEGKSRVSKAWVPAVPAGGAYHKKIQKIAAKGENARLPSPDDVRVIVLFDGDAEESDIDRVVKAGEVSGLIINKIEKLDEGGKRLFKQSYPSVDFDRCWILEVDRKRAGYGKIALLALGGIAVFGWAVRLFSRAADRKREIRSLRRQAARGRR